MGLRMHRKHDGIARARARLFTILLKISETVMALPHQANARQRPAKALGQNQLDILPKRLVHG